MVYLMSWHSDTPAYWPALNLTWYRAGRHDLMI